MVSLLDNVTIISSSDKPSKSSNSWEAIKNKLKPTIKQEQDKNPNNYVERSVLEDNWPEGQRGRLTKLFECKNHRSAENLANAFDQLRLDIENVLRNHPKMQDNIHRGILVNINEDNKVRVDFLRQGELDIAKTYLKEKGETDLAEKLAKAVNQADSRPRPGQSR